MSPAGVQFIDLLSVLVVDCASLNGAFSGSQEWFVGTRHNDHFLEYPGELRSKLISFFYMRPFGISAYVNSHNDDALTKLCSGT